METPPAETSSHSRPSEQKQLPPDQFASVTRSLGSNHQPNLVLLLSILLLSLFYPPLHFFLSSLLLRSPRLFSRVMNTGSQFVMEGVKNLVLKQHVGLIKECDQGPGGAS